MTPEKTTVRLIRDKNHHGVCPTGSCVTIGNFDGLHLGHQTLISRTRLLAETEGLTPAVLTFHPTAKEFFQPDQAPARIYSASERISLLRHYGLELIWCLRFNQQLAAMTAAEFVEQILVAGLNARHVVVGSDFRFGRAREGDVHLLADIGQDSGFAVHLADLVEESGERVSSTLVRSLLWQGDFQRVRKLLNRPYQISGRVVRGQQLGRQLGFPTANIRLHRLKSPLHGIYAVKVDGPDLSSHHAVASVGSRPTVSGKEMLLEVHLFDFDGDLYGQRLDVEFVAKLRDEVRFDTLDALTQQMHLDADQARAVLDQT